MSMCEADPDLMFCDPLFVSIPFIVTGPEHSTLSKETTHLLLSTWIAARNDHLLTRHFQESFLGNCKRYQAPFPYALRLLTSTTGAITPLPPPEQVACQFPKPILLDTVS